MGKKLSPFPKSAEIALNCMGNSAPAERFGLRGLQKITRAAGGLLQAYTLGILMETSYQDQTLCKRPTANSQDEFNYAGVYEGRFWPFWLWFL